MTAKMQTWWNSLSERYRLAVAAVAGLLALAVLALIVVSRTAPDVRLPFFGSDPWPEAIAQAQETLAAAPDFENHLAAYAEIPSEIDGYLGMVEKARVASSAIDDLHALNIPFVGSAWSILSDILNGLIPGSAAALNGLDDNLRQILALKGQLTVVRDPGAVTAAVQAFKETPTKQTLQTMRKAMAGYSAVLAKANGDMQPHLAAVSGAADKVTRLQQSIQRAQDAVNRIPLLPDAVRRLNEAVSGLFSPLTNLHQALQGLRTGLAADVATMQAIEDIVYAAEHPSARR